MSFSGRDDLDHMLKVLDGEGASDLHLGPGRLPIMRKNGNLTNLPGFSQTITVHDMEIILEAACRSPTGPSAVQSMEDLDFSYELAATLNNNGTPQARYRVNASGSLMGIRMTFRRLPPSPPPLKSLNVPEICTETIETQDKGLILVTGPTGSGKSTTLAGWVRHLLELNRSLHIITLENPIEFRYDDLDLSQAYITQRELNRSLASFTDGMKSALRQDPDIILVGEMRDVETIRLAMEAADTGHLVLGTAHTSDVPSTISRIVQMYPANEQQAARIQLISSLRMIVCQQLVPAKIKGRCAAREYLVFEPEMRRELLTLEQEAIPLRITEMTKTFGKSMGASIKELYLEDKISEEVYKDKMAALQESCDTGETKENREDVNQEVLEERKKKFGEKLKQKKNQEESFSDRFAADQEIEKKKKKENVKKETIQPIIEKNEKTENKNIEIPQQKILNNPVETQILQTKDNVSFVSIVTQTIETSSDNDDGGLLGDVSDSLLELPEDPALPMDFGNSSIQDPIIKPIVEEPWSQGYSDVAPKNKDVEVVLEKQPTNFAQEEPSESDWDRWEREAESEEELDITVINNSIDSDEDNINLDAIAWAMGLSVDELEQRIKDHNLGNIKDSDALQKALNETTKKKKKK